jgi:Fe-S cluster biogenesis protein NfuA
MMAAPPQLAEVEEAVAELDRAMRSHGGGIEYLGTSPDGALRLKMTGLCQGCLFRPVTVAGTIAPFIEERLGCEVEVQGARISEEAEARLAEHLEHGYVPPTFEGKR